MKNTPHIVVESPFYIPSPYYRPAMFALDIYRSRKADFNYAVEIAMASYPNISRKKLHDYLLKYIATH